MMVRLDLGAGERSPEGFTPLGREFHGTEIYPLPYPDNSVDIIRAAHVVEHYPHGQVGDVIKEWVRALKPGGILRIAVPDFKVIAEQYLVGNEMPIQSYIMGGQADADDYHKSLFDRDTLRKFLADAGLVLLQPWTSELEDCAAYPISLNIQGTKPFVSELHVCGAMSVPRLGFMDNSFCAIEAAMACSVKFRKHGGAFWGQSLTKVFERIIQEDDPDLILSLDYDSIFTPGHLARMIQTMMVHPEIDALAPIQSSRHLSTALFTVHDAAGENAPRVPLSDLTDSDVKKVATAHFGLTLIRTAKLKALPKPWFMPVPSPAGDWNDGHVDEDIEFWRKWARAGNSLYLANRVAIGHAELMIRLPGKDLQVFYESITEFQRTGAFPPETWA